MMIDLKEITMSDHWDMAMIEAAEARCNLRVEAGMPSVSGGNGEEKALRKIIKLRERITKLEAQKNVDSISTVPGVLRARIAELESTSKTYYTKNLALREHNAELEAQIRPAEGLPTYKELVEQVHTEYVRIHDEIINAGLVARSVQFTVSRMFGLDEEQAEQLCTVLNRDPNTGDVIE